MGNSLYVDAGGGYMSVYMRTQLQSCSHVIRVLYVCYTSIRRRRRRKSVELN